MHPVGEQGQDMKENNVINIIGKIISDYQFSHEVYKEGFFTFNVEVSRLSTSCDILPITISERLIDKEKLAVGMYVEIVGQIRSYNNFIDKKNHLILTVFVRQIQFLEDEHDQNPNQAMLNGFVCKEPIYRTTPFGREITDILLAVNRSYNKSDYIPCIFWGRNARFTGNLKIGDHIKVNGRMQSRNYQKKFENGDVLDKVAYEVSVSKIETMQKDNTLET